MRFLVCRRWLSLVLVAFAVPLCGASALAAGNTRIQQSDGTVKLYTDVRMRLSGDTLWVKSADHKGVLEVQNAACSFVGEIRRCLPSTVTLHQHGRTHQIALQHGTVYLNLTGSDQQLPLSTKHIAANGLLVSFKTVRGTYVSVSGVLDEVKP